MPWPINRRNKRFVRTDGQDSIQFTFSVKPRGIRGFLLRLMRRPSIGKGKSESISSGLARPYRQLAEEGRPVGTTNFVLFKGNEWPSHVLGSLCFSAPGHRLLFFPGLTERAVNWALSGDAFRNLQHIGFLDHLTLEKGFRKWHATIFKPDRTQKIRLQSFPTKEVAKGTRFWFGLTIQDANVLETTPEELTVSFPCPPRDTMRRGEEIMRSIKGAIRHVLTLNSMSLNKGEFVHFDFFIGPSSLTPETLPCFAPMNEPLVYGYAKPFKDGWHLRAHPVSLEGITEKIWIVVSKHVGSLHGKALILPSQ